MRRKKKPKLRSQKEWMKEATRILGVHSFCIQILRESLPTPPVDPNTLKPDMLRTLFPSLDKLEAQTKELLREYDEISTHNALRRVPVQN